MTEAEHVSFQPETDRNWEAFYKQDVSAKIPSFSRDGRIYDCIYAQQFNRPLLDELFTITDKLRDITKTVEGEDYVSSLLRNKRTMLWFTQPSTRTFLSFLNACQILGMNTSDIRDAKTSSEAKLETFYDTVRTFSSYADVLVMRHPEAGAAEKAAWTLKAGDRPIPVLNGGSGPDQHPTQALLDVYTLDRYLQRNMKRNGDQASAERGSGIDGKKIALVGDLKRGRTVRSLAYLMKNYWDVELTLIAPEQFKMESDIRGFLDKHGIPYHETDNFEEGIRDADAIYMTRVQDEHDATKGESAKVDYSGFGLKPKHMRMIKKSCIIMHPLPRRTEIDSEIDQDPRAVYWKQERNGMWVRAALMSYVFKKEGDILGYNPVKK